MIAQSRFFNSAVTRGILGGIIAISVTFVEFFFNLFIDRAAASARTCAPEVEGFLGGRRL